jgi:hypothetical protein
MQGGDNTLQHWTPAQFFHAFQILKFVTNDFSAEFAKLPQRYINFNNDDDNNNNNSNMSDISDVL